MQKKTAMVDFLCQLDWVTGPWLTPFLGGSVRVFPDDTIALPSVDEPHPIQRK